MKSILISVAFFLLTITGFTQSVPEENRYLGMTAPGNIPLVLPLSVNKGCFAAERIAISNDGREIYYSEIKSYYPVTGDKIKRYTFSDGKWKGPFDMFAGFGPALSQNGDTLYFERMYAEDKYSTYISVRKKSGWSDPERILTKLDKAHYYHVTRNGNKYISSLTANGAGLSDWCRIVIKGADTTTLSLGRPLNTSGENQDFFISADESYMIVTNRPALAISYRNYNGSWTNPINLGPKINFGLGSWGPWVTPDNKYLFYTTGTKPDYSDVQVYWVRIDGVIDSIKETVLFAQNDVSIGKSKKFQSKILRGEVTYHVHLPDGYENSKKKYPVIYMMNGQSVASFANAASTVDNLSNERIPDMILIGISNTGVAAGYQSCPDDSGKVKPGDSFGKFLKDDLIPEINRNYRTNDYRILFGQSNTGLFVLYNLMIQPDLFNVYVVASPMFGWCPQFYAEQTSAFLKNNPSMNKKLYVSYGDLDYVEVLRYINDFKEILKQSPAGFQYKVDLIENAGHVPFITLNNSLLYIFSECTINAEKKKLSIPEIKSLFEKLSTEYGFTVAPKAGVLFDMAIDKKNEKEYERAIELFKYLNSLYPGSEIYHYVLGQTYQLRGDIDLAKESFNESLRINPEFSQAKKELKKIKAK